MYSLASSPGMLHENVQLGLKNIEAPPPAPPSASPPAPPPAHPPDPPPAPPPPSPDPSPHDRPGEYSCVRSAERSSPRSLTWLNTWESTTPETKICAVPIAGIHSHNKSSLSCHMDRTHSHSWPCPSVLRRHVSWEPSWRGNIADTCCTYCLGK